MGESSIERERLGQALTSVHALVDSGDFASLDRDELLPLLRDVEALRRLLAVVDSRLLFVIDAIGLNMVHGASSTQALVRQELQISPHEASARTRAAVDLSPRMDDDGSTLEPVLPRTAEALAEMAIGFEHAMAIRQFIHKLSRGVDPAVKAAAEATLVEMARTMDPQQLRAEAKQLQAKLDPDGVKADDDTAHENRSFRTWKSRRGTLKFEGELPADAGEMLQAALSPLAAPKPTKDEVKDTRTPAQRNADGLIEMLARYLKNDKAPKNGGTKATIFLTMQMADLKGDNGIAHGSFGGKLSGNIARKIACDAQIIPAVMNSKGVPLDVGRRRYSLPVGIRHALRIRDKGCAFPGCDRPPEWTDGHHIQHWSRGGKTSVSNCCLLCPHHHDVIHREEWEIEMIDGLPWFKPPARLDQKRTPIRNTVHRSTPWSVSCGVSRHPTLQGGTLTTQQREPEGRQ